MHLLWSHPRSPQSWRLDLHFTGEEIWVKKCVVLHKVVHLLSDRFESPSSSPQSPLLSCPRRCAPWPGLQRMQCQCLELPRCIWWAARAFLEIHEWGVYSILHHRVPGGVGEAVALPYRKINMFIHKKLHAISDNYGNFEASAWIPQEAWTQMKVKPVNPCFQFLSHTWE